MKATPSAWHTFDLARVAADPGMRPAIFSSYGLGDLPAGIRPIARTTDYAGYAGGADRRSCNTRFGFLAERFRAIDGATIFWYHGVTPPRSGRKAADAICWRRRKSALTWRSTPTSPSQTAPSSPPSCSALPATQPTGCAWRRWASTSHATPSSPTRRNWPRCANSGGWKAGVLLYVGRIAGNKRIDLLVDALSLLAPAYPDLHLLVVGDTQDGVVTQELTASLRRRR